MLLKVQTAKTYTTRLSTSSEEILFEMWKRWSAYSRLPSISGKRTEGRRGGGRRPARISIKFNPQPHIQVRIARYKFWALLDSGSEISFISAKTIRQIRAKNQQPTPDITHVNLANGTKIPITKICELPVTIHGKTIKHRFLVLPNLRGPILIGTDLWAKLWITISPPPLEVPENNNPSREIYTATITPGTIDESQCLEAFLAEELPKFENIRGPTNQAQHQIRLKPGPPIKQRYRVRNPAMQAIIDEEVRKMEEEGIIEPSSSAWSSPYCTG